MGFLDGTGLVNQLAFERFLDGLLSHKTDPRIKTVPECRFGEAEIFFGLLEPALSVGAHERRWFDRSREFPG